MKTLIILTVVALITIIFSVGFYMKVDWEEFDRQFQEKDIVDYSKIWLN